jgi:NADPH-dependent F420 reductase
MELAIVGGTGAEGFGLALRLARAGHAVTIGSRDAARGADAASKATGILGGDVALAGTSNDEAAASAAVVILTVPFAAQADICRSIASSVQPEAVVVDATSPLATAVGGRPWQALRPWHGSAAEQAAALLGAGQRIVAAFHTIAAHALTELEQPVDSDVLVCGDDQDAKEIVGALIAQIPGLRWVDCGSLSMARIVETLTPLLISINRNYRTKEAGFRIVGRDEWGSRA